MDGEHRDSVNKKKKKKTLPRFASERGIGKVI